METAPDRMRRARPLLGTFVEIAAAQAAQPDLEAAIESAFDAVARVHRLMSFHDPESDLSRLNREAAVAPVTVDPWTYEVLRTAEDLHRQSGGLFDIAVAPMLQAMGMLPDTQDAAPAGAQRRAERTIELLPGGRVRFTHPGVRIDLGGIAKGFAVDRAVEVLRRSGVGEGVVNAGGDLAAFGPHPLPAHIRDPLDPSRLLCRIELRDCALASSGARFDPCVSSSPASAQIIDPRSQRPVCAVAGATVCAGSGMLADALTKLVMIEREAAGTLLDQCGASALMVLPDGTVHVTANWQGGASLAA